MFRILGRKLRVCEESERSYAVVERHQDDILAGPVFAVELGLAAPAFPQTAAENPHCHRQFLVGLAGSFGPHVEIKAILAVRRFVAISPFSRVSAGIVGGLEGRMAEFVADANSIPGNDGLRGAPAVLPDGRSGVRDSTINSYARSIIQDHALDLSAFDGEDRIPGGCRARGESQRCKQDR